MLSLRLTHAGQTLLLSNPDAGAYVADGYVPTPGDGRGFASDTIPLVFEDAVYGRSLMAQVLALVGKGGAAARYTNNGLGSPVYLELQPNEGEAWWRSEIVPVGSDEAGRVEWATDTLFAWRLPKNHARAALFITRRGFWEASEEIELPLSNGNGTEVTGGLTVWNHDDGTATLLAGMWTGWGAQTYPTSLSVGGGHDNWAVVHTDALAGDLPAPARLVMSHATSGVVVENVYVGLDQEGNANAFTLEAESATASSGTGYSSSTTASVTFASGGSYRTVTWTESTERELMSWTLTSALLAAAAARPFRLILRFFSDLSIVTPAYTNLDLRLTITPTGVSTVLAQSELKRVTPSRALQELATLRLPPALKAASSYQPLTLHLNAKRPGGGTLRIDDLLLLPTDGFRKVEPRASGWGVAGALVIDESEGAAYIEDAGARSYLHKATGKPLLLLPGTDAHRLHFVMDLSQHTDLAPGDAFVSHGFTLQAFTRERRSSI